MACVASLVASDGNGTRSFETLLRYRGAAMADFWRALKTLKAEQAAPADTLALLSCQCSGAATLVDTGRSLEAFG